MMGKFDFVIPDDFMRSLGRLADVDKVAPMMIDEAMPILESSVKQELSKHRRTGDMVNSVKKTKTQKNKAGNWYAVVRPTGVDSKGVRNMEKLAHAEYGTAKQRATPILTKAIADSQQAVQDKMREVYEREMKQ